MEKSYMKAFIGPERNDFHDTLTVDIRELEMRIALRLWSLFNFIIWVLVGFVRFSGVLIEKIEEKSQNFYVGGRFKILTHADMIGKIQQEVQPILDIFLAAASKVRLEVKADRMYRTKERFKQEVVEAYTEQIFAVAVSQFFLRNRVGNRLQNWRQVNNFCLRQPVTPRESGAKKLRTVIEVNKNILVRHCLYYTYTIKIFQKIFHFSFIKKYCYISPDVFQQAKPLFG